MSRQRTMHENSKSILIVDDTKFSSALVKKTLIKDGFTDIRVADNAIDALSMLKERNADIMIADWLMPGMDGLALTQLVRELNRRQNTFTYVVLLTAKEENDDLKLAFSKGVDDFIGKTTINTHLLPRIHAAERISSVHNSLLKRELVLKEQFRKLTLMNRVDPTTGIGNEKFMSQQLDRYLKQHQGRNGNIGLLLCRLDNIESLNQLYGEAFKNELLKQASQRLQEAARPLDDIARINEDTLALALYGSDPTFITHKLIHRVEDSLLIKAYETEQGYVSLKGTIHYEVINANGQAPESSDDIVTSALTHLDSLEEGQSIHFWEIGSQLA